MTERSGRTMLDVLAEEGIVVGVDPSVPRGVVELLRAGTDGVVELRHASDRVGTSTRLVDPRSGRTLWRGDARPHASTGEHWRARAHAALTNDDSTALALLTARIHSAAWPTWDGNAAAESPDRACNAEGEQPTVTEQHEVPGTSVEAPPSAVTLDPGSGPTPPLPGETEQDTANRAVRDFVARYNAAVPPKIPVEGSGSIMTRTYRLPDEPAEREHHPTMFAPAVVNSDGSDEPVTSHPTDPLDVVEAVGELAGLHFARCRICPPVGGASLGQPVVGNGPDPGAARHAAAAHLRERHDRSPWPGVA